MSPATVRADLPTVHIVLPHQVSAVADARRDLDDYLRKRRVPVERRQDAQLVLSELISNAIRHAPPLAAGMLRVCWRLERAGVYLEVTDGRGITEPRQVPEPHPESLSGRGLAIVTVLTSSWGVRGDEKSRTVHAVVPR